jgi:hypothetical protein
MLRTLICVTALLASAPAALAEDFPHSAMGMEIVGDGGTVLGRVSGVQRNSDGRIVAIGADNMEAPASAPADRPSVAAPRRLDRLPPYRPPALIAMADENDRGRGDQR